MNLLDGIKKFAERKISSEIIRRFSTRIMSSPSPLEDFRKEVFDLTSKVQSEMETHFSSSTHIGEKIANITSLITTKIGLGETMTSCVSKTIKINRASIYNNESDPTLAVWLSDTIIGQHTKQK